MFRSLKINGVTATNPEEIREARAGGSMARRTGQEKGLPGPEMKHFSRSDKLSTLVKTTLVWGPGPEGCLQNAAAGDRAQE